MSVETRARSLATLAVLPLDPVAAALAPALVAGLSRRIGLACRLREPLAVERLPAVPGREQVDADRLLERLEHEAQRRGAPDEVLVGITALDMGSPLFTHFFGRARLGGRAALVSVARLAPSFQGLPEDGEVLRRRAEAEILHEIGHALGLTHCPRPDCLMRFAATVEAIDLRGETFCAACEEALPPGLRSRHPR